MSFNQRFPSKIIPAGYFCTWEYVNVEKEFTIFEAARSLPKTTTNELMGFTYVYQDGPVTLTEGHVNNEAFNQILEAGALGAHEDDQRCELTVVNVLRRPASSASEFYYIIPHNHTVHPEEELGGIGGHNMNLVSMISISAGGSAFVVLMVVLFLSLIHI